MKKNRKNTKKSNNLASKLVKSMSGFKTCIGFSFVILFFIAYFTGQFCINLFLPLTFATWVGYTCIVFSSPAKNEDDVIEFEDHHYNH